MSHQSNHYIYNETTVKVGALPRPRAYQKWSTTLAYALPYFAVTFLSLTTSVAACEQKYIVEDRTNLAIVEFFYLQKDGWSTNLLASVVSPRSRQMIKVVGQGASQYKATLSGNHVVFGQVADICAYSEILIMQDGGTSRMVIR